jgi:hypothetical protein
MERETEKDSGGKRHIYKEREIENRKRNTTRELFKEIQS